MNTYMQDAYLGATIIENMVNVWHMLLSWQFILLVCVGIVIFKEVKHVRNKPD